MGSKVAAYYSEAESLGGLEAKIKLATLTRIPSTRAQVEDDTPDILNRFEAAMRELRELFGTRKDSRPVRAGQTSKPGARRPNSEELLWGVLSSLHLAMFALFDPNMNCAWSWSSPSLSQSFGAQASEQAGEIGDFLADKILEVHKTDIKKMLEGAEGGEWEMRIEFEGATHWLVLKLSPLYDNFGKINGVTAFAQDITKRKASEELLRASEQRLREHNRVFLDLVAHKSMFLGDVDKTIQRITEAASKTLNVARASVWFYDAPKSKILCADLYEREHDRHSSGVELLAASFPDYFQALLQERTIAAHDAHTDPRTSVFSEPYLTPLGINSMLDVPIWVHGEMVGVVCHEHVGPQRHWTTDEENFAYLMANFVALAEERATERQVDL